MVKFGILTVGDDERPAIKIGDTILSIRTFAGLLSKKQRDELKKDFSDFIELLQKHNVPCEVQDILLTYLKE
jgi:hypothetical protein